jgi:phosphatidylglycerophosphate synthase
MAPLWTPFSQRQRNAPADVRERVWTVATVITLFRALACNALIISGIASHDTGRVLVALALNMVLDSVDGEVARRLRRETVFGAQADGAVDRFLAMAVVLTVALFRSGAVAATQAALVTCQFVLVDQILCAQFLRFGLWSPDHFYVVDETVWRLNWSPLAKLVGNVPLLLFTLSTATAWIAVPVAVSIILARAYSYAVVRRRARELVPEQSYAIGSDAAREAACPEVVARRSQPVIDQSIDARSARARGRTAVDVADVAHA